MSINYSDFLIICGWLTVVFMVMRVLTVLQHEFPEDEEITKDPLSVAANGAEKYDDFKKDNWRAFNALSSAYRLHIFMQRFNIILNPSIAKLTILVPLVALAILTMVSKIEGWEDNIIASIGGVATLGNLYWLVIIEQGKKLRKKVERLKV